MSESADFDPGVWRGHDFRSARAVYDHHVRRSYEDAVVAGKNKADLIVPSLTTNSPAPLIIVCDVTGSMGEWPATIFSKLPYLELEGKEYLGEGMEICFAAVGDAHYHDQYPLQVREFAKGTDLKDRLKELVIEGGGGGQTTETYELAALYFARNVTMSNAISPIIIFIGDEQPYDFVDRDLAKSLASVDLQTRMSTEDVFAELKQRYSVYLVRKPYCNTDRNEMSPEDLRIRRVWEKLLGEDHISDLPQAGRVVDVIFGILAKETGRIDYFKKELEGRQKPDQVKTVMKSLATIHELPPPATKSDASKSKLRSPGKGSKTKPLV